jgi:glycosyltransferase involved in cell wall biosynthesis
VKVAIVVQRYGADISGGAELHARYVAEHLARHVEVEVLTTCARDYISWRNEIREGADRVNGITVRRFPVASEREPKAFAARSEHVFTRTHAVRDELAWLDAEGPTSPALVTFIKAHESDYDFFVFFSFRYYHSFHGPRAVPGRAILVPTAERDAALGLGIFPPVFRGVRAFMYNSHEERALIQRLADNADVPGVVVGIGSEIPEHTNGARFRQKFGIRDRFAVYVGRIDENKGCRELFEFFEHYSSALVDSLHLVLIGHPIIEIPNHPRIHHVGFVDDRDKFDAIAASELLIMPSYFESLSMVALEAWALGKPVLANAKCDVLQGQCLRSNGGLYYHGFQEFFETLRTIDSNAGLAAALGRNGSTYFQRHYSWPVIEQKYLDMLRTLAAERPRRVMEPLPGWWARRRQVLRAADEVVRALPTGPVRLRIGEDSGSKTVDDRRLSIGDSRPRSDGRPGRPERDERPRSSPAPPPIEPPRSQERTHPSIPNRQSATIPDPQSAPIRNGDRRGRRPRRRSGAGGRGESVRGGGGRRPRGGR